LWTPQDLFPQIPVVSFATVIPASFGWALLVSLLVSFATMAICVRPVAQRVACLLMGLSTFGLVLLDQHRLQPWAWQFMILSVVLCFAEASKVIQIWRCLVIGIYAWSAWSKLDHSFFVEHGPFLLDGLCRSIGLSTGTRNWPDGVRYVGAAIIPMTEFLIAVGLCFRNSRRFAVFGAVMMHLCLLLALGPLGHQHQPGVLIWNVFFIAQNWFLFVCEPASSLDQVAVAGLSWASVGNWISFCAITAALAWPIVEPLGLCDHWPAWAVYAAKPERVHVFVNDEDYPKLPDRFRPYLGNPDFDGWSLIRIDRWSLDAVYAPIYPQDRFQVGVALWLVDNLKLNQIRLIIQGPANRWNGARVLHEYSGAQSLEQLGRSYRVSAMPSKR
jgi:hypothetical protein